MVPVKQLVEKFQRAGFEIWVVSGSIHWAIAPAVETLGIPETRVIATSVTVLNGVLQSTFDKTIPYREGKKRLIEKIVGEKPLFVAGNSTGDANMLEMASDIALTITSAGPDEHVYESEIRLQELVQKYASQQKLKPIWLSQNFQPKT